MLITNLFYILAVTFVAGAGFALGLVAIDKLMNYKKPKPKPGSIMANLQAERDKYVYADSVDTAVDQIKSNHHIVNGRSEWIKERKGA